jgi:hypothetical protein
MEPASAGFFLRCIGALLAEGGRSVILLNLIG